VYICILVAAFFQQSGAIFTVIEDVQRLSEKDLTNKKRVAIATIVVGPIFVIFAAIQNIYILHPSNMGGRIVLGVVLGAVTVVWWIVSTLDNIFLYWRIKKPPRSLDVAYFISLLSVVFFSLFNVFLTFAWVTLGLLLNPTRVAAFFVAFLTIFAVVFFKANSLQQLLKETEAKLHVALFKTATGKKGAEITEDQFNTVETLKLEGSALFEYFKEKGLTEKQAEDACISVLAFRRFRVRFLIGSLFGTLLVLTALIVFILMGVSAFRLNSGVVTSVGSVLEGASGVGAVANDKVGDKQEDINNMIHSFTSKRALTKMVPRESQEMVMMTDVALTAPKD